MLIEAFIYYFWRPNSIAGSTLFHKKFTRTNFVRVFYSYSVYSSHYRSFRSFYGKFNMFSL